MTSLKKGHPFEVVISDVPERTGVVFADQVKSTDWRMRKAVNIVESYEW